ncbi:MAG: HlyD family efflux transporter periplasmic adaptor subunit [Clostridia bacterium]|nr:HlyD family efflux transporter periplasmic adaptor subunit [Clostridia bacterium]
MLKKSLSLLAALALAVSPALAETYSGTTVAARTTALVSEAGGVLESLSLLPGQSVAAGETVGSTRAEKVFAAWDGTVALCHAEAGDSVDGAVLEISPTSRYTVYCTVDGAYGDPETELVHTGEQLYLRCTANGTHKAIGVVTSIDGAEYQVEVIGGELYVGETVNLYRDADFSAARRVGVGTAVVAEPIEYSASGTLIELCVTEGEEVERGELLFTYAQADSTQIICPAGGVVASVLASPGDVLKIGQSVAELVQPGDVRIQVQLSAADAARIQLGDAATYIRADDPDETPRSAIVEGVSAIADGEDYVALLVPEDADLPLGLSVEVRIGE